MHPFFRRARPLAQATLATISARRAGAIAMAVLAAIAALIARPRAASARDEGVLELHADVTVGDDATISVADTILVWAAGTRIRHGISWDIPTRYRDETGHRYAIDLESVRVTRDGQSDSFTMEELRDGERLHIGRPEVSLEPGTHVYVVSYQAEGAIAFFSDHESLCFAAKHPGTELPIAQTSVVVHPPDRARSATTMTGFLAGGSSSGGSPPPLASDQRKDAVVLTLTRPLAADEALAVTATWPKGGVHEPGVVHELVRAAQTHRSVIVAFVALLLQLLPLLAMLGLVGPAGGAAAGDASAEGPHAALGLGFSLVVLLALVAGGRGHGAWAWGVAVAVPLLMGSVVVMGWSAGCLRFWKRAARERYARSALGRALVSSLLVSPLLAAEIAGLAAFAARTSTASAIVLFATGALDYVLLRPLHAAKGPRRGALEPHP